MYCDTPICNSKQGMPECPPLDANMSSTCVLRSFVSRVPNQQSQIARTEEDGASAASQVAKKREAVASLLRSLLTSLLEALC